MAGDLAETRKSLAGLAEKLRATADELARTVVVAPVEGTVVNLRIKTAGGVIGPGEALMDIVPATGDLLLEARVAPVDIDEVHPGLEAQVHLLAYQSRNLPRIEGTVREVAKRILTTPLDDVREADNGGSALGALASAAADIIMVDGELPDMEIADFIRHVRAMSGARQPKIIVMMTEMNLALMTKAKRAGANDYLLKPFDRSQLTRRLQEFQRAA